MGAWTLPGVGRITSPYGPRVLAGAVSNFHAGTDLGTKRTAVYAARDGIVRTIWKTTLGAWVLDIRHPDEGGRQVRTRYIHMYREEITVAVGQAVRAGQRIGTSGASGTSAAHLHFEVMVNGANADPVPFMAARGVTLGVTTVTNPGGGTGGVPVAPDVKPPPPIVPEEDIMATLAELDSVIAARTKVPAYRIENTDGAYLDFGSCRRALDAEQQKVRAADIVGLSVKSAFWHTPLVGPPSQAFRKVGDTSGAVFYVERGGLVHVDAARYAADGKPTLRDLPASHAVWTLHVLAG